MDEFVITPAISGLYKGRYDLVSEALKEWYPNLELKLDTELALLDKFVPLLESGHKTTTVRYAKGKIRLPSTTTLLLYETKADDKNYKMLLGDVFIPSTTVKSIDALTDEDGKKDGFSGKEELISVIEGIYGKVSIDELVSIYTIGRFDRIKKF